MNGRLDPVTTEVIGRHVLAAAEGHRQVPIVYVQGADYVPEFLFPVDALLLAAGEGQAP